MKEFLQDFIRARGGTLREVHAALLAPTATVATVQVAKSEGRIAFEQAAIAAIANLGALIEPDVPAPELLARVATMTEPQIKAAVLRAFAAASVDGQLALVRAVLAVLSSLAARETYGVAWPPTADFGQPAFTREEATPGPSPWATAFPDQPPPTLDALRKALA